MLRFALIALVVASSAAADILPGFRLEKLGECEGFLTSIAIDSRGNLYYSTTAGGVYRLTARESHPIARVDTANEGNAALLGIAFRGDDELIAHYVTPDLTADVIASIEVATGEVREIRRFFCDEGRPCSSEHRGGNPIVAADGSVFVAIGDLAGGAPAQNRDSPAGKVLRIAPDGSFSVYALGFRNPYDLAIDPVSSKLIVGDNGAIGEDEINLVGENDNAGWPYTMGSKGPVEGMLAPAYSFPETIAPTGMTAVNSQGWFPSGILVGGFVTRAVYFFPMDGGRFEAPIVVLENPPELSASSLRAMHAPPSIKSPIIDVAQDARGEIYVGTSSAIFRLLPPLRGDGDGNGKVDAADAEAIAHEILDGDGNRTIHAQEGSFRGSWGCDANRDRVIDARDLVELAKLRRKRSRAVQ